MIIHFFQVRDDNPLDFTDLIDEYFDKLPNVTVASDEAAVDIECRLPEFDYAYHFYITKRSRVSSLYKLNANFKNTNMYIDIDPMIPTFISRIILTHVGEVCERYRLQVYPERATDIDKFDMFQLISALSKEKLDYLEAHNEYKQHTFPSAKLNDICQYQVLTPTLGDFVKTFTKAENYVILYDKYSDEIKLGIDWHVGTPSFFPPYLDFILVKENEALVDVIPSEVFYKYCARFLNDVRCDDVNIKIQCMNERNAKRATRFVQKMKKQKVSIENFSFLKIINLNEA